MDVLKQLIEDDERKEQEEQSFPSSLYRSSSSSSSSVGDDKKKKKKRMKNKDCSSPPSLPIVQILPEIPPKASLIQQRRNSLITFDSVSWSVWFISKNAPYVPLGKFDSIQECQNAILLFKRSKKFIRLIQPSDSSSPSTSSGKRHHNKRRKRASNQEEEEEEDQEEIVYKSKYRGVKWNNSLRKWQSQICEGTQRRELGVFDTEEEAALAYNERALETRGEKTKTLNKVATDQHTYIPFQRGSLYDGMDEQDLDFMNKIDDIVEQLTTDQPTNETEQCCC